MARLYKGINGPASGRVGDLIFSSGREIHIWLAYRSEMMESYSESVYMGQFFTQKPNDHGNS